MTRLYHGIDVADVERMAKLLEQHPERAAARLFTASEQEYCGRFKNAMERYAGRFAVKEAVMKMLGTGWSGQVVWTDIETTNDAAGKPGVRLSGEVARLAEAMGIEQVAVSITHAKGLAIASVIGWGA